MKISCKVKKILVWASAYLNVIAFVLVGGYFMLKDSDEKIKRTCKRAFIVWGIFIAINIVLDFFYNFIFGLDLSTNYRVYNIINTLVNIFSFLTFVVFLLIDLFADKEEKKIETEINE